jgi:hypothetical protein
MSTIFVKGPNRTLVLRFEVAPSAMETYRKGVIGKLVAATRRHVNAGLGGSSTLIVRDLKKQPEGVCVSFFVPSMPAA